MSFDSSTFQTLAGRLTGRLLTPEDPSYDQVRQVWNGAVDRRPAVIARCRCAEDVAAMLRAARTAGLPVAVRGGGHSIAGLSTCDDGLMIDLSLMKDIRVDVPARRAFAQPGVLGGELDQATQQHGLGTTLGTVGHTGIAGLTLGGGMGWMMRKLGLACDNVRSVEAVLADGTIVRADSASHPDLFWALRGGGGRFAVVTEFEYELYSFGPKIALAQFAFEPAEAEAALRAARDLAVGTSRERDMWLGYLPLPEDDPDLPDDLRGKSVFAVMGFSADPVDADGAWLAPLHAMNPLMADTRLCDYAELQGMFDEDNRHGVCAYSKGAFIGELTDEALAVFVEHAPQAHGEDLVYLQQMGGRVADFAGPGQSPVQSRTADYVLNIIARWTDASAAERSREWVRDLIAAMQPHTLATRPLNFEGEAIETLSGASGDGVYGESIQRLREVKRRYDPDNILGAVSA